MNAVPSLPVVIAVNVPPPAAAPDTASGADRAEAAHRAGGEGSFSGALQAANGKAPRKSANPKTSDQPAPGAALPPAGNPQPVVPVAALLPTPVAQLPAEVAGEAASPAAAGGDGATRAVSDTAPAADPLTAAPPAAAPPTAASGVAAAVAPAVPPAVHPTAAPTVAPTAAVKAAAAHDAPAAAGASAAFALPAASSHGATPAVTANASAAPAAVTDRSDGSSHALQPARSAPLVHAANATVHPGTRAAATAAGADGADAADDPVVEAASASPDPAASLPLGAAVAAAADGVGAAKVQAPTVAKDESVDAAQDDSGDSPSEAGGSGGAPSVAIQALSVPARAAALSASRAAVAAAASADKPLHGAAALVARDGTVDVAGLQTAETSATVSAAAPAPNLQVHANVDSAEFPQGLSDRVSWMVNNGVNSAKLQVNPPQLGPIELSILVQGDHALVSMTTHSAVTRDVLESSSPQLREMLGAQGFGQVSVDISQRSFQERPPYSAPYERSAPAQGMSSTASPVSETRIAVTRTALGALDAYA